MKAKRLTALALAALMTASGTSVAFAETPTKDKPLTFYDGAIGEQLYMMDEDGYIVAANNGDFAPGDDIYLALQDYDAASKRELDRINAYEFLDIGDKWVDDIDVVYKKGKWIEQVATSKNYTTKGFAIDDLNGIQFESRSTNDATLIEEAKKAIVSSSKYEAAIVARRDSPKYVKDAWIYDGDYYPTEDAAKKAQEADNQQVTEEEFDKLYETVKEYYTVGTETVKSLNGISKADSGFIWNNTYYVDKNSVMQAQTNVWKKYDGSTVLYKNGKNEGDPTDGSVGNVATSGTEELASGEGTNIWVNIDPQSGESTRYVDVNKITNKDFAKHLSCTQVLNEVYFDTTTNAVRTDVVYHNNTAYFKLSDGSFAGTDKSQLMSNLSAGDEKEIIKGTAYYHPTTNNIIGQTEAHNLAKTDVDTLISGMNRNNISAGTTIQTRSGSPTGSYDGYVWNSGFAYWVKISTEKSTSTKEFDLVGKIGVGSTKSKAEDNTVFLDVTLTNRNWNEDSFENVDSDAYIEPGQRAVLSFADDADDVVIEFGDDAYYEFNARGQGRVNFAYNTNFDRDFAYDYDHANIDFINFVAEPTTNKTGTLYIYADEDSYIYEVTSKGAKKINGAYYDDDEGAWVIRTRHLTSYAISDRRLKTIDQMEDDKNSSSSSKPSGSQGSGSGNGNYKPIPDTGR